ncbi:MAG TPA: hypothetical protein VMS43_00410 [Allosphingosinicella sp.]|nr:hypothetical protein [Allosphingosinicella sp.]
MSGREPDKDEPRTAPKKASRLIPRLHSVLALTAEAASLAGLVGFIAAIALDSFIFNRWGLTFLQIASPTDVILSGLQNSLVLAAPCFVFAGGWLLGRDLFGLSNTARWRRTLLFLWAAALVSMLWFADALIHHGYFRYLVGAVIFLFAALVGTGDHVEAELPPGVDVTTPAALKSIRVLKLDGRFNSVFICLLIASTAMLERINDLSDDGMFSARTAYLLSPELRDCHAPYVLWAGERAVVVQCPPDKVRVLYQPGDLQIGVNPGRPAMGAPSQDRRP